MKIAISGAGIAGPALAYWLLPGGHQLTLIEKAPHFRDGGYVIDFWGVGYIVAERMGILPAVKEAGYSVREVRIVDDRGRRRGGFSTDVFQRISNGRFTSLPRGDLAAAIFRTIEDRVETIFNNSITQLVEHESGLRATLNHRAAREFDLVVGADGLHSGVRGAAFGPESQFEKRLGYAVAAFETPGYRPRDELVYVAYSKPGRQIARFSLRGDRTMFLFVFVDEQPAGESPIDLPQRRAILHRAFEDAGWECPQILDALDRTSDLYFDRVSQIKMDSWSKGRVVLLGDAAACALLLAGEGAGLALAEAYVLAGELSAAGLDYRAAFRRYEQRLRPFVERKQAAAVGFASSFAPKTTFGIWCRDQVTKLLAVRGIADRIARRMMSDDFELPDYTM